MFTNIKAYAVLGVHIMLAHILAANIKISHNIACLHYLLRPGNLLISPWRDDLQILTSLVM